MELDNALPLFLDVCVAHCFLLKRTIIIPGMSINKSLRTNKNLLNSGPIEFTEKHPQLKSTPRIILITIDIIKIVNIDRNIKVIPLTKIPEIKNIPPTNSIQGRINEVNLTRKLGSIL